MVSEYTPSSVIKRNDSDIWVHPMVMEGAANLVALDIWLSRGEFAEVTSIEESIVGGVDPREIPIQEPARFLGTLLSALKDRTTAAVSAVTYGASHNILDRISNQSVEGIHEFFRNQLAEMERFYPQIVLKVRESLSRPGVLDGFYATREDVTSGSGSVTVRSFWHGTISPSTVNAPNFVLSPSLTIEEGFRLMASPPVARMRAESFAGLSSDLNNLASAIELVFKRLSARPE